MIDLPDGALDAFDVYRVGTRFDGAPVLSRDARMPTDDTVVWVPGTDETTLAEMEEVTDVVWLAEPEPYDGPMEPPSAPEVSVMPAEAVTAAAGDEDDEDDEDDEEAVDLDNVLLGDEPSIEENPLPRIDMGEPADDDVEDEIPMADPELDPAVEDAPMDTGPVAGDPEEPVEEEPVGEEEPLDDELADTGGEEGEAPVDEEEEPVEADNLDEAEADELGDVVTSAEARVGQVEGMVAELLLQQMGDTPFLDDEAAEARVATLIPAPAERRGEVAGAFTELGPTIARVAALMGEVDEIDDNMAARVDALVERLDALEESIAELMVETVEDEEMPDLSDSPEYVDETLDAPPV